jgi:hypothetical protein
MATWIKMRTDLRTHPKVVRISSALKADTLRTLGGLLSVWSLFDAHSHDGQLQGYTTDLVDELIGWPGFAGQMKAVGWLETASAEGLQTLVIPRFDQHNGTSSKRRCIDAERKQNVRKMSASKADTERTKSGPDKIREEYSTPIVPKGTDHDTDSPNPPSDLDTVAQHETPPPEKKKGGRAALAEQIYALYPRKVGKVTALRAIERVLKAGKVPPEDLLVTVRNYARAPATWPAGDEVFIPHPATWFNSGRYDDDPREWLRGPSDLNPEPPTYLPSTYDGPEGWRAIMDELYGDLDWRAAYPTWQATEPGDREKIKARLLTPAT